jgi:hypothetical protein
VRHRREMSSDPVMFFSAKGDAMTYFKSLGPGWYVRLSASQSTSEKLSFSSSLQQAENKVAFIVQCDGCLGRAGSRMKTECEDQFPQFTI